MMELKSGKKNILWITLVLLIVLNAAFLYIWQKTRVLKAEAELLLASKEKELYQTLNELNHFKGKNAQLDSLIAVAALELSQKSLQLDSIIQQNKITANQLDRFKRENKMLNVFKNRYLAQIDSLLLITQELKTENIALRNDLTEERTKRTNLQAENNKLNTKVALGAQLAIAELNVQSFRLKSNGEEVSTTKAKNLDRLKACFTLLANQVAEEGNRTILMRIISPDGSTLYNQESGSGKFDFMGKETLFTIQQTVTFKGINTPVCINWSQLNDPKKGEYTIEIYIENRLMGSTQIILR